MNVLHDKKTLEEATGKLLNKVALVTGSSRASVPDARVRTRRGCRHGRDVTAMTAVQAKSNKRMEVLT
jgi:hypothetical protein